MQFHVMLKFIFGSNLSFDL